MKKVRGSLLCIISVLLLGIVFYTDARLRNITPDYKVNGEAVAYTDVVMGIALVEDVSFLEHLNKLEIQEKPQIFFENTIVPYSSSENTIYVPQNAEVADWEGTLSSEKDTFLCTKEGTYWNQKTDAIQDSYEFPLWLVTKDGYYEMKLIMSGLPVIVIETERFEEAEDIPYEVDPDKKFYDSETKYYGQIRVFNPGVGTEKYEITECHVTYHEKGISSSVYPKKGYSLSLLDADEENLNMPLLGMRSDNSWKLNALMSDPNKIREKAAAQIWEQMDLTDASINEAGPRMEYTEVVLDDEYLGLYCLVEPVDEKKLELDGNDVLYKIIDWGAPSDEEMQLSVVNSWRIALPIRVRYPDIITDYEAAWYPVRDYLNIFYRDYWQYGGGIEKVDLGNACDMVMFFMACTASDNNFKNLYLAADVTANGEYVMRHIPWDVDLTFGNIHDPEADDGVTFNEDVTVKYWDAPISTMLYYEIDGVSEFLNSRWNEYRATVLSTENILQILNENRDYLVKTGGYIREQERWPEYDVDEDISYLVDYQKKRMEWLDTYFESLK